MTWTLVSLALLLVPPLPRAEDPVPAPSAERGVALPASALGGGRVETMEQVLRRSAERERVERGVAKERNGAAGEWIVPSRSATGTPHSGEHYAINRWGDTRMGIGFPERVDVAGAWVAGQASRGAWAGGLRVVGYRGGVEVARTEWFEELGATPVWFAMELSGVERIVFEARAVLDGAGWFALDDLTFAAAEDRAKARVVDFDDLPWRARLSGSGYAGLTWERGGGAFEATPRAIDAPRAPAGAADTTHAPGSSPGPVLGPGPGTAPDVVRDFVGMRMFEDGTSAIPADTCGAVGPEHFVSVVNVKLGVFDKASGARVFDVPLDDFFGTGSLGDPRVTYDHHAGRYFLLCSSGPSTARIHFAISTTSDPTGPWFKSFIETAIQADAGRWPDYPTLGFDQHGYYTAALMVPSTMTIWAIDKAPLLAATPSVGTVSAWRNKAFEGAIQPCVTFGDSGGELLLSRRSSTRMRIRQITGPLTAPSLAPVALIDVPANGTPPDAPAMGSNVDLATGDTRPMNAVYRDGSVYTAHAIEVDGRSACRWYEFDVAGNSAAQIGTIADPVRHYSYPSISVNAAQHVVLGFSGSHAGEFAGAFYTGRNAFDPPGVTAPPRLLRQGSGPYNHVDGNGTARWGDYSLTSIDPTDDTTFWTIQKYARVNNRWGTWIGELAFADPCPTPWITCATSPHSSGFGASIGSGGSTSLASNSMTLLVDSAPPGRSGLFFYGETSIQAPFGDGFRCVGGSTFRLAPVLLTDGAGTAFHDLDLAAPPDPAGRIEAGSTWYFQFWFRDPMGPGGSGFNLSDSLGATFCP